jgi:hypothetical protein
MSAVSLLLCLSLLSEAKGQKAELPSVITVRRLDLVKLVDKKRQPIEVGATVSLQTTGVAISSLRVFYRSSTDAPFSEALCELLPNLKYYVRLTYSPRIEYYFVATPLAGSRITFDGGTIIGSDLEPRPWASTEPGISYVGAAAAGIIATVVSVLTHSDEPAVGSTTQAKRNSPALYVGVGALAAGAVASITYLSIRHQRCKERLRKHRGE